MKRILITLPLVLCFITGCHHKATKTELDELKAQLEIEEQNKAKYKLLLAEGDKMNFAVVDDLCSPDLQYFFPSNSQQPFDLAQFKEFWKSILMAFPDLNHTIEEVYAIQDIVVTREVVRGTHKGMFMGLNGTDKKIEIGAVKISRWIDGKIIELRDEADMVTLYQQIGFELKIQEENE